MIDLLPILAQPCAEARHFRHRGHHNEKFTRFPGSVHVPREQRFDETLGPGQEWEVLGTSCAAFGYSEARREQIAKMATFPEIAGWLKGSRRTGVRRVARPDDQNPDDPVWRPSL